MEDAQVIITVMLVEAGIYGRKLNCNAIDHKVYHNYRCTELKLQALLESSLWF